MGAIEEIILDEVKKSLESGLVEKVIREKVEKAVADAVQSAFSWGDTNKAIRTRVDEVLVPAIQRRDLSAFVPKLDMVLTEIINSTTLCDNKRILENFKDLMIEPKEQTITVSKLFDEYKKFVAQDVDTCGREVNTDDGSTYVDVAVNFEVEKDESRKYSCIEYLTVHFSVDDEDENEEALNLDVPLSRWKKSRVEGYDIDFKAGLDIQSLRYMNSFECVLNRLKRAGVKVLIDKESDWDSVTPDAEPECTWE